MGKFIDWLNEKIGATDKKNEPQLKSASGDDGSKFEVERFQHTPNPDAGQFLLNDEVIASGTKTFGSAEEAKGDAMATALFKVFGVESVFATSVTTRVVSSWLPSSIRMIAQDG